MLLSLERLRLEMRRSQTLMKASLLFLSLLCFLVLVFYAIFAYVQKAASSVGHLDAIRLTFFSASASALLFSIVYFLAFRAYLSTQAESAWLQSHEAAFSVRMQSVRSLAEFGDELLRFFEEAFGTRRGAFMIRTPSKDELVVLKTKGSAPQNFRDSASGSPCGGGIEQARSAQSLGALKRQEPFVMSGQSADFFVTSSLRDVKSVSVAVVPLVFDSDVLGVAELHLAASLDDADLMFLRRLSCTAGTALKTLMDRFALEEKNTELRDARDALEERAFELARISRFKSDFVANVSHELRTPLNSVIILAGLLTRNREGNLSGEQIRYLGTIDRSAKELLGLIDDILDLSRIEAGRLALHFQDVRFTSLLQIWEDFAAAQANRAGVTFKMSLADNLPSSLFTDEMRLGQAVRNFLANAFKFTPKGGRVTLEVKRALRDAETVLSEHLSDENCEKGVLWPALAFTVRDTGPGIPRDKLDTIFEAFNQVDTRVAQQFGGTGLGLAIASNLARLLGGTIEVDTMEGTGSAFTLIVPIRRVPRVLVVENDLERWQEVRQCCLSQGLLAVQATDVRGALGILESQDVSVILLDVKQSEISEDAVFKELQLHSALKRVAPLVILSGRPFEESEKSALAPAVVAVFNRDATSAVDFCRLLSEIANRDMESKSQKAPVQESKSEPKKAYLGQRALVVDDDERNVFSLRELLAAEGFDVVGVSGGREAIALARRAAQEGHPPFDVVLCDLMMPVLDGYETLRTLRGLPGYNRVPLLAVSAKTLSGEAERTREVGATAFVSKPVNVQALYGILEDVLPKASSAAQRVLVVDDCPHVGGFVQLLAARAGASAVHVENSSEALAALLERREPFDVVITDLNMPGLGGEGLLNSLRSKDVSLPVFVLTAETDPAIHAKLRALGFEDILVKPLSLDTLSRALHSVRGRSRPVSENSGPL